MQSLRCWQLGELRLRLWAEAGDHRWLEEMWCAEPAPHTVDAGHFDFDITLRQDDDLYTALAASSDQHRAHEAVFIGQAKSESLLGGPGGAGYQLHDPQLAALVIFAGRTRIDIVGSARALGGRILWLRVIRDLWVRSWTAGPMLHAACAAQAGLGVAIVGCKGAGKSSLLTYLMLSSGFDFVANDRLVLDARVEPASALGVATVIALKPGTEFHFPKLRRHRDAPKYMHRRGLQELDSVCWTAESSAQEGPLNLSRAQFTNRTGSRAPGVCRLGAWVFPEFDGSLTGHVLERLEAAEAEQRLRHEVFATSWASANKVWSDLIQVQTQPPGGLALPQLSALHLRIGTEAWRSTALADSLRGCLEAVRC